MPAFSGESNFLVLDQGTSSTKCFLFDTHGQVVFSERIKHGLARPKPHHVECNAEEIYHACTRLIQKCIDYANEQSLKICSMGLAVQRSTFLFWDKETVDPLSPALSWQDSRAVSVVDELQKFGSKIHKRSGVPLSAHFGGAKFLHMINNDSNLRAKVESSEAWFGSLSTYLVNKLTGKPVIDHTVAGRSQLMNIDTLPWDNKLLSLFETPVNCLPEIIPTVGAFGNYESIPLACVIGDQQSALIGQGGVQNGFLAMNFGTSGSVLLNSGKSPQHNEGLLNNVLYSNEHVVYYLTEGSINACNSLFYWLETELDIPHKDMIWDQRCAQTETNGVLIAGFSGLAAPYWKSGFETVYSNLENADHNEIVRAGMESIGFLVHDIMQSMCVANHAKMIPASGGAAREPLLQFIADILDTPIGHTTMKDRTAYGVFCLLKEHNGESVTFSVPACNVIFDPKMDAEKLNVKLEAWKSALQSVIH